MAQMASSIRVAQQQHDRTKALVIPREHGGWGLLLVPMVTGACIGIPFGHGVTNLALLAIAVISLFWLRTPLEAFFGMGVIRATGTAERKLVLQAMALIAPIAIGSVASLIWLRNCTLLLVIGAVVGFAFATQACMRLFGRKMRMPAQMVGALGLTSTAAAGFYVVTGALDGRALAIWLASWVFAGNQIHYVQVRMRTCKLTTARERYQRARNFLVGQVAMLGFVLVACRLGWLPPLTFAAFIPVIFRGVLWLVEDDSKIDLPWLGVTELLHSITFGVLLTSVFFLHR